VIRQRYEDFTGEYVLHCHFLGHEDRGMMFSVQTICPTSPGHPVDSFSKTQTGAGKECSQPNAYLPAGPRCAPGAAHTGKH
jgi:hypothetical protein